LSKADEENRAEMSARNRYSSLLFLKQGDFFMNISSPSYTAVPSSGRLRQVLQQHPLISFFAMAYSFSWIGWLPYVLSQSGLGLLPFQASQLIALPGAYLGPLLSGFLMTAAVEGKSGVRHLWQRFFLWRVNWRWYLFAIFGTPAMLFLGYLSQPGAMAVLNFSILQLVGVFAIILLLEIFTSGLAEEPGWRGFALPRLQKRCGPLLGTIILGILWGGWHLPLFLTAWSHGGNGLVDIVVFILTTIGTAITITWMFNHTRGSLLLAVLLHAAIDAFGSTAIVTNLFPLQWMMQNNDMVEIIGFVVFPLLLIIATRGRLGYQEASDVVPAMNDGKA
jgi:uncharacterized protein